MNRILFEPDEIHDGCATFSGVRAEHVLTVLHGEVGQTLKTGVLDGPIGTSVIERIEGGSVTVLCTHETPSLPSWIDLILAPPRPRVMKRLLPQLATLGVRRIFLVGAEKVEKAFWGAQLLKEEIYRPLLIDGLQQAGTTAVPTIETLWRIRRRARRARPTKRFYGDSPQIYGDSSRNFRAGRAPYRCWRWGRKGDGRMRKWRGWRKRVLRGCRWGRASCARTRRLSRS